MSKIRQVLWIWKKEQEPNNIDKTEKLAKSTYYTKISYKSCNTGIICKHSIASIQKHLNKFKTNLRNLAD